MTRLLLSAAVLALTALPAAAVCNTAALNGTWLVASDEGDSGCLARIRAGKISGACGSGTISLTSSCAISGTLQGASFKGRTEAVGGIAAKPNLFLGYGAAFGGIAAYRQ